MTLGINVEEGLVTKEGVSLGLKLWTLGIDEDSKLGVLEGSLLGEAKGSREGCHDGTSLGSLLGSDDSSELGSLLGSDDGSLIGSEDGSKLSLLGAELVVGATEAGFVGFCD